MDTMASMQNLFGLNPNLAMSAEALNGLQFIEFY